jgi:hypothetical protein
MLQLTMLSSWSVGFVSLFVLRRLDELGLTTIDSIWGLTTTVWIFLGIT